MVNTPLWKRGVRGDFQHAVHIQSFKYLMLDKYELQRVVRDLCDPSEAVGTEAR